MTAIMVVWLMFGFILKHFVCDFVLQGKYQWSNKHILGHPGGILHALIHAVGTVVVLFSINIATPLMVSIALGEAVVHYFVDFFKMNINKEMGWKADTHPQFWVLTGFDQFLHYLTYIIIIALLI